MSSIEQIVRRIAREEVRAALEKAARVGLSIASLRAAEVAYELSEREQAPWMLRPLNYNDWWFTLPTGDRPPRKVERRLRTAEAAEVLGVTRGTLYV